MGGYRAASAEEQARRVDDRGVISRNLHMLKAGYRWFDCPRLRALDDGLQPVQPLLAPGLLAQVADALVDAGAVRKSTVIDSTCVKGIPGRRTASA